MTDPRRGDPDELLRRVQEEEAGARRGKLKIFFGAAPGVGKTYSMLDAARREKAEGRRVVVGVLETHGREETKALLEGLDVLPKRRIPYRGLTLEEFDLDAALARKPQLLLVDELAHTNAEGSRHRKRWQDVMELLDAGVDVWTTLNVQHLESLNDVVAQVTGVTVRETVPDDVLSRADAVELVDLPPEGLLERLAEGKVYPGEQARRAAERFFRLGNLLALREMALKATTEHVDEGVRAYREREGISATWPVAEHVLVCVGPGSVSAALVRAGRRMAARLDAPWTAVHVERRAPPLSEEGQAKVNAHLRLAEQLGADVVTLRGDRVADEILDYARRQNATRLVVGRPSRPRWREILSGSLVDTLVRRAEGIDVVVTAGEAERAGERGSPLLRRPSSPPWQYGVAVLVVALATALSAIFLGRFDLANFVMIYLMGVLFVALRLGRGPSVLAAVLSVAAFDFFFVPPRLTFAVSDVRHVFTFLVMLAAGLLVSGLTARVAGQAEDARGRERRTAVLYRLTRDLSRALDAAEVAATATRALEKVFAGRAVVLLPDDEGRLAAPSGSTYPLDDRERGAASWAFEHEEPAGLGTATLPSAKGFYLPLSSGERAAGILGLLPVDATRVEAPEERQLLATFGKQTALALERARLAEEAVEERRRAEREEMRTSLLSSVSHDLRTPLAAITGAATTLLERPDTPEETRRELLETMAEEAARLNRLVGNLLDMTRLSSGELVPRKEWASLEEIVGSALARCDKELAGRDVRLDVPPGLPLVEADVILLEQALVNLLENTARHTPSATRVDVSARVENGEAVVEVADRGPGLPAGPPSRVFERFFRGAGAPAGGSGLGLAIVRAIAATHGGRAEAELRPEGGSVFRIRFPAGAGAPKVPGETAEARA